jgi:hypothetical protein
MTGAGRLAVVRLSASGAIVTPPLAILNGEPNNAGTAVLEELMSLRADNAALVESARLSGQLETARKLRQLAPLQAFADSTREALACPSSQHATMIGLALRVLGLELRSAL